VLRHIQPAGGAEPGVLRNADLELDEDTCQVCQAGRLVGLSPTEFKLLRRLLRNPALAVAGVTSVVALRAYLDRTDDQLRATATFAHHRPRHDLVASMSATAAGCIRKPGVRGQPPPQMTYRQRPLAGHGDRGRGTSQPQRR
jgi:DNA-binding response OmpR family regulator